MKNYVKINGIRTIWYMREVENLAQGNTPYMDDEFSAAKRIAMGTLTGTYEQRILALKNITPQIFASFKAEFIETYKETKFSSRESPQERSIIILQNQKEVFTERDFIGGFNFCNSQIQLMESLPVIGYSIKIKRFDGHKENPWRIAVTYLAVQHKVLDSTFLYSKDMNVEMKNVSGRNEEINAVLPLFSEEDFELFPLIRTKLFKLLISYIVTLNIDTYEEEAYLALLAHSFVFFTTVLKTSLWSNCLY